MKPIAALPLAACLALTGFVGGALASEPTRLTHDGRMKFTPVCTAEDAVVYAELVDPKLYQLRRMRLSDGSVTPLHLEASTSEFEPDYSLSGDVYAFCRTTGTLQVGVAIARSDGTILGQVPPGDGFAGLRSPAVSPDAMLVAYSYAEQSRQQIFVVDADGGNRRQLTDSRGQNNWPHWSPDGTTMAFASSRDNDYEVYTCAVEGGEARRLTHSPASDIRPRYSPDGRRIAFTSHRDGNAEVYVMSADGTDARRLTQHEERDDYPAWTRDGRSIVFVGERGGRYDLYWLPVE